jgi:hypothetical protein
MEIPEAGEEVVVSYGSHSNDYLFVECLFQISFPPIEGPLYLLAFRRFHTLREQT